MDACASAKEFGPVTIAVAPNGGRRMRSDHGALPITPGELARTAAESAEAGAAMIHVHARDAAGFHSLDPDLYRAILGAIRAETGDRLVVQISSESVGRYSAAAQMAAVGAVRPEAVSLALREFVPAGGDVRDFAAFLQGLKGEKIAVQFILYAPAEALQLAALHRSGLVPWDRLSVLYVIGSYGSNTDSHPLELLPFLAPDMPGFDHWMVCAFGRQEAGAAMAAAVLGGHCRVGFENNLCLADRQIAPNNAALVSQLARLVRSAGCSLQTATQLRAAWAS